MKKIIALLLSTMLLLGLAQFAYAEEITAEFAATELNKYDLFRGTEKGYELDRVPTRLEALIMIIRLKGYEWQVNNENWNHYELYTNKHSFTDVPVWGANYVHCGVYLGLTNGISKYEFGSDLLVTAEQYTTLLLRALAYDDSAGYYSWDNPWELSDHIGLTNGNYSDNKIFTRGDLAILSYKVLSRYMKNSPNTLYYNSFIFQKLDNPKFPEQFWGNDDYMDSYKYDSFAGISIDEMGYGSVSYVGKEAKELILEMQNPTIASLSLSDTQSFDNDGVQQIQQNFEITGLRAGKTFVKVTFANSPDSHAISFLEITVTDE
jgi:hypothetical protein